jgi:hypothetical protein
MYHPIPPLTAALALFQTRWRRERDPQLRPRWHWLVPRKAGQVTTRRQAAAPLAVHRDTSTGWLRQYRHGGWAALWTYKEPGAPSGPQTLPPAIVAPLQARLAPPTGCASSVGSRRWLRDAWAWEVPDPTLHGLVRYQRKATRTRPRPRHATETSRPRRTAASTAPAA